MQIRLTVTLAVSILILGASYAFADGILNDSTTTRSRGGVGNYLFWSMKSDLDAQDRNELVNTDESERRYEDEPAFYGEELSIRQSSAIAPRQMVLFDKASAKLDDAGTARLDEIANTLKSDTGLKAQITGYTSAEGENVNNEALSGARAAAVVERLRARGVSESQLKWAAKGEREPLTANDTAEGRAQNRRVEIHFE